MSAAYGHGHDVADALAAWARDQLAHLKAVQMRAAEEHLHVLAETYDLGGVALDNALTNADGTRLLQLAVDFGPDADLAVQSTTAGWFLLSIYLPHRPGCRLLLQGHVAGIASDVLTRTLRVSEVVA